MASEEVVIGSVEERVTVPFAFRSASVKAFGSDCGV
jgi:hypothetical protein